MTQEQFLNQEITVTLNVREIMNILKALEQAPLGAVKLTYDRLSLELTRVQADADELNVSDQSIREGGEMK